MFNAGHDAATVTATYRRPCDTAPRETTFTILPRAVQQFPLGTLEGCETFKGKDTVLVTVTMTQPGISIVSTLPSTSISYANFPIGTVVHLTTD